MSGKYHYKMLVLLTVTLLNVVLIFSLAFSNIFVPSSRYISKESRTLISTLFPQGWSFFTRDPQEEFTSIRRVDENGARNIVIKNSSIKNWFGIKRYSNIQMAELSDLILKLPNENWHEVENQNLEILYNILPSYKVINKSPQKMICDTVILVKEKPIPWAYSAFNNFEKSTPIKAIKIYSICN